MVRLSVFLLSTAAFAVQFIITPAQVTQCAGGAGQVTLRWTDAGPRPVQIRLFRASGPPMTGWEGARGEVTTGVWVANGMAFVLVDETESELARVTAAVRCNAVVDPPGNSSFLPLAVGNRWVYRLDSRVVTSAYEHWRVTGNEEHYGRVYAVLMRDAEPWLLREDEQGRVLRLLDSGREETLLDPAAGTPLIAVSIGLGDFSNVLPVETASGALIRESLRYARGVGLVWSSATMVSGSSGGFTSGRQLVEAEVNGRLYTMPAAGVELSAESTVLDVTHKAVTNCAVPCYFTACLLAPGADPPGTYKPCFRTRVVAPDDAASLELLDAGGLVLAGRTVEAGTTYVQLPLYSQPNAPFAPGEYRLRLRLPEGRGESSLRLRIE